MRYWHARLNRCLFKGKLHKVKLTHGPSTELTDGSVYGLYLPCENVPYIHIDEQVATYRCFINTLVHEMVHQLQHAHKLPVTHGRFFKVYVKRFSKLGLEL